MTITTVGELITYLQRYNPGMRILKANTDCYLSITVGEEPDQAGSSVFCVINSESLLLAGTTEETIDVFMDATPQDPGSFEAIVL